MKNYIEKITKIVTVEISQKKYNEVNIEHMCVGPTKGTYRRDIKMIVNHDFIKQCIIFAKFFVS